MPNDMRHIVSIIITKNEILQQRPRIVMPLRRKFPSPFEKHFVSTALFFYALFLNNLRSKIDILMPFKEGLKSQMHDIVLLQLLQLLLKLPCLLAQLASKSIAKREKDVVQCFGTVCLFVKGGWE